MGRNRLLQGLLSLVLLLAALPVWAATDTLRPDAAGDSTVWTRGGTDTGANYSQVNESASDSDTTYVTTTNTSEVDDLYNVSTVNFGTDTIAQIQVFLTGRSVLSGSTGSTPADCTFKILIKEGGTTTASTGGAITSTYAEISNTWTTNPRTGTAWMQSDIDGLQIGVRSKRTTGSGSKVKDPRTTQMYVVVTHTAAATGVKGMMTLFGELD